MGGGDGTVSVADALDCVWTASSSAPWITIQSGASGSSAGTVSYMVASNASIRVRTGTMTIAGQTFTVEQAASLNCIFALSPASITLAAKGGSKTVKVNSYGIPCDWTAVSNDPFITITGGGNGTGKGKVTYSISGNTNTTALSGTMTIAGQTFTVNQAAGGCIFKLSPKAGKLKATGGTAVVKVKPNFSDCAWTAISNDSFITITGGSNGLGSGAVSYTVAPNTNTTTLTGSITIGGQTFAVTQAGAK